MQRTGDDKDGFSVELAGGAVQVVGWGFWSVEVAGQFGELVAEAARKAPKGTALAIDVRELKPMRDEAQAAFSAALGAAKKAGMAQVTIHTKSPLTKLQVIRIVRGAGSGAEIV